ncbi:unnamed protein product [Sphenostylis stenocarpa]|uniref:Uncharacterized protein n=1 Tax=Sphenostylis stenocarpa TaxID=92480 RepID=A0AA86V9A0_9FABA|nr:unnamed protein product [Sphenostylis stenocarpa]
MADFFTTFAYCNRLKYLINQLLNVRAPIVALWQPKLPRQVGVLGPRPSQQAYNTLVASSNNPVSALHDPNWKNVMTNEYNALIQNKTWKGDEIRKKEESEGDAAGSSVKWREGRGSNDYWEIACLVRKTQSETHGGNDGTTWQNMTCSCT